MQILTIYVHFWQHFDYLLCIYVADGYNISVVLLCYVEFKTFFFVLHLRYIIIVYLFIKMLKLCIDLLPKPTGTRTGDILTNSLISGFNELNSLISGLNELNSLISGFNELNLLISGFIELNSLISGFIELNSLISGFNELNSLISGFIELN